MKSVLITGCSSDFGMLDAVTLAKNGFRVFATLRPRPKVRYLVGTDAKLQTVLRSVGGSASPLG
jgi:NADP-dependent 3-hydroxy acid dehydrogenase YdfG